MISPRELIPWTCLAFAVVVAAWYEAAAMIAQRKSAELATDLLESEQLAKELKHESDYWRGMVQWHDEHRDRSITTEEADQMWERIIASKPQFEPRPAVVISHDGQLAHYQTLDELIAPKGSE